MIWHLLGGPGGQLFSRLLFGGARAALLSIFGSMWDPSGSPFGDILVPFGVLIFSPISEQKLIAFLGGAGGRGGLPVPAKLAGFARTC